MFPHRDKVQAIVDPKWHHIGPYQSNCHRSYINQVSCIVPLIALSFLSAMSYPNNNSHDFVKHSKPIPIGITHSRRRSASTSSSDSSGSPTSPSEPQTPLNNITPPRMMPINISPTNSPILSYFIAQSPTKTATFPFNRKFPGRPPVFEGPLTFAVCTFRLTWLSLM
jgi:hypothetical protein